MIKQIIDENVSYPVYEIDMTDRTIQTTVDVNGNIPIFVIDNGIFSLHLKIDKRDIAELLSVFEIAEKYYKGIDK